MTKNFMTINDVDLIVDPKYVYSQFQMFANQSKSDKVGCTWKQEFPFESMWLDFLKDHCLKGSIKRTDIYYGSRFTQFCSQKSWRGFNSVNEEFGFVCFNSGRKEYF